ncbi:SLC13 family permease [Aeromicrobium sp. CF3.5]|uniref:SLC13 family permease n=1 Tax=Aeromicrobium sp. CF3.5 TaxID=3373078 RepID=UPI003EE7EC81
MTQDVTQLAEVVAFLVAIMVLATASADAGLFDALGARVAGLRRDSGRALAWAVVGSAAVTVVLSLDATVVLLTPILMVASAHRRDHAYATVRLANSGSVLLPVSNLTNLLVFPATGLTFFGFAWAMLPVWLVAVTGEYVVLRRRYGHDVSHPPTITEVPSVPLFPAAVLIVVLLALSGGAAPWIPATAGAVLVAGWSVSRGWSRPRDLVIAANLPLAALVLVWGSFVAWVARTDVGAGIGDLLPRGTGLLALIVIALLAMVAANLINNLPATLLLLPAATLAGPEGLLALLIGVNVGANLTVIGSLANLLWRRTSAREVTTLREFHRLGLWTTPPLVVITTATLWAWTSLIW